MKFLFVSFKILYFDRLKFFFIFDLFLKSLMVNDVELEIPLSFIELLSKISSNE